MRSRIASASSRVVVSAQCTSSSATTTGCCRANASSHRMYASRIRSGLPASSAASTRSRSSRPRPGRTSSSSGPSSGPELRPRLRSNCNFRFAYLRSEPAEQSFHERPGAEPSVRQAVALEPCHPILGERTELREETCLAHSGVAHQQHDSTPAGDELAERSRSWAISASRPTTGVVPATGSRAFGPTSVNTDTGAARPLTSKSPSGSKTKR